MSHAAEAVTSDATIAVKALHDHSGHATAAFTGTSITQVTPSSGSVDDDINEVVEDIVKEDDSRMEATETKGDSSEYKEEQLNKIPGHAAGEKVIPFFSVLFSFSTPFISLHTIVNRQLVVTLGSTSNAGQPIFL